MPIPFPSISASFRTGQPRPFQEHAAYTSALGSRHFLNTVIRSHPVHCCRSTPWNDITASVATHIIFRLRTTY